MRATKKRKYLKAKEKKKKQLNDEMANAEDEDSEIIEEKNVSIQKRVKKKKTHKQKI